MTSNVFDLTVTMSAFHSKRALPRDAAECGLSESIWPCRPRIVRLSRLAMHRQSLRLGLIITAVGERGIRIILEPIGAILEPIGAGVAKH